VKVSLNYKYVFLAGLCGIALCILPVAKQAQADCLCRGDVDSDIWVTTYDLLDIIFLLASYGSPFVAPAGESPCADVADVNATGIEGGNGQVDIGDLNFLVCYLYLYKDMFYRAPCAPVAYEDYPADPNILIWVNDTLWNGISQVTAGDVIKVGWYENETAWCAGFCNFNLNVSRGEYLDDFNSPVDWDLINFAVGNDGQGGINAGGGCSSFMLYSGPIFTFSFRVPVQVGPAYTIHIHPTQGSWRRVMFNQLPTVDLQVEEAVCIASPESDLNDDCKVNLLDLALIGSEWLVCGIDVPACGY
jgi:hypothetical protein